MSRYYSGSRLRRVDAQRVETALVRFGFLQTQLFSSAVMLIGFQCRVRVVVVLVAAKLACRDTTGDHVCAE